jgi:hypothetical protein
VVVATHVEVERLAEALAPMFGAQIDHEWGAWDAVAIEDREGLRLVIRACGVEGVRAAISGSMTPPDQRPHHWTAAPEPRAITVSLSRKPADIAADIRKRLFPGMAETAAANRRRREQEEFDAAWREDAGGRLKQSLEGVEVHDIGRQSGSFDAGRVRFYAVLHDQPGRTAHVDWEVLNGHVKLEAHFLPPELAARIAETIADWEASR